MCEDHTKERGKAPDAVLVQRCATKKAKDVHDGAEVPFDAADVFGVHNKAGTEALAVALAHKGNLLGKGQHGLRLWQCALGTVNDTAKDDMVNV